jgi:hypothetical protein
MELVNKVDARVKELGGSVVRLWLEYAWDLKLVRAKVLWKRTPVFPDRPYVLHQVGDDGDLYSGTYDLSEEEAFETR